MTIATQLSSPAAKATTPMMEQYLAIKTQYPDCLVFYRMGDFYELFFDDAIIASSILDIALTKRGKHDNLDIAMCGVPHHSNEYYLHKLIKSGHKVAMVEQLESPQEAKKRGYKAVVRREVVRIITPGTITEDNLLESKEANYLASVVLDKNITSIAWIDLSTGEFNFTSSSVEFLAHDLARIAPKELLISDKIYNNPTLSEIISEYKGKITTQVDSFFDYQRSNTSIKNFYQVNIIDSFADFTQLEIATCGAIIEYINITQRTHVGFMPVPTKIINNQFMIIDEATKKNLELLKSLDGNIQGSTLAVIDQSKTGAGSRLLASYLTAPLIDKNLINKRLDQIEYFYNNHHLRLKTREILTQIPDLERALSRVNLGRGSPRDLLQIKNSLTNAKLLYLNLDVEKISNISCLNEFDQLIAVIENSLKDEVPNVAKDGNFVRVGFNQKIDDLRNINITCNSKLQILRDEYRAKTGITNLKIEQNNMLGFYIEVTTLNSNKVTDDFIFKQNTTNYKRYTTNSLRELENEIINASDILLNLELAIFDQLVSKITDFSEKIFQAAKIIAQIDVFSSLAEVAVNNNYKRPIISTDDTFIVKDARHLVVEASNRSAFIANDCDLTLGMRIWLITGPNMAGKSTFLRQNALIAILAQMGGFVPASYAQIGIIDRIFSRVGAGDDLARGRSTFMVEMVETATILNQATSKSLVILDEIGRGTATYDGLSIAFSSLEYIHDKLKCRALFATHYHEITKLSEKLANVESYSMKVKEWQDKVIFLHKVIKGAASRSYGIYVAKLAGVPIEVIKRAEHIMKMLESQHNNKASDYSLPLFGQNLKTPITEITDILNSASLNDLSKDQAIKMLLQLKDLAR